MPDFIHQLRSRLLELGCPVRRMRQMVLEVADHREDLAAAARAEGLTLQEAEERAEARLGEPLLLAEDLMGAVRRSTWCGRHRLLAFGLLPLLTFPVLWLLVLFLNFFFIAVGFGWDKERLHAAANNPVTFHHLIMLIQGADYVALAAVTCLFCWLANRAATGGKWLLLAGVICALYSLFLGDHVSPHNFSVWIGWRPQWVRAAIPLLMVGLTRVYRRRQVVRLLQRVAAD